MPLPFGAIAGGLFRAAKGIFRGKKGRNTLRDVGQAAQGVAQERQFRAPMQVDRASPQGETMGDVNVSVPWIPIIAIGALFLLTKK